MEACDASQYRTGERGLSHRTYAAQQMLLKVECHIRTRLFDRAKDLAKLSGLQPGLTEGNKHTFTASAVTWQRRSAWPEYWTGELGGGSYLGPGIVASEDNNLVVRHALMIGE